MIVGFSKLTLSIQACHSLKEKRGVIRRVKDRTFNKFKVPVSEVGSQDKWQRAELGFSIVGNDKRVIEGLLQKIENFIEDLGLVQVIDSCSEIINV